MNKWTTQVTSKLEEEELEKLQETFVVNLTSRFARMNLPRPRKLAATLWWINSEMNGQFNTMSELRDCFNFYDEKNYFEVMTALNEKDYIVQFEKDENMGYGIIFGKRFKSLHMAVFDEPEKSLLESGHVTFIKPKDAVDKNLYVRVLAAMITEVSNFKGVLTEDQKKISKLIKSANKIMGVK